MAVSSRRGHRQPLLRCGVTIAVAGAVEAEYRQPVGTDGGRQRTQLSHTGGAELRNEDLSLKNIFYQMGNAFSVTKD